MQLSIQPENHISSSSLAARLVGLLALLWAVTSFYLDIEWIQAAALYVLISYLTALLLYTYDRDTLARCVWLFAGNTTVYAISLYVHPDGQIALVFVPLLGIPFLIFNWYTERKLILTFSALPVVLWYLCWVSASNPAVSYEVGATAAQFYVAPAAALAAFGLGAFEIWYFLSVSLKEHRSLKQALDRVEVFEIFAESSLQGMGWAAIDGTIRYSNPKLAEMLNVEDRSEVIGNNVITSYYPEEEQKRLAEEVFPEIVEKGFWSGELLLKPSAGEMFPTMNNLFLIRDGEGKPVYIANVVTDISEQKEAQKALEEAATVFQVASEGIVLTDADANITRVNRSFTEITGYDEVEVVGKNPNILNSGHHDKQFFREMWKNITDGGYWEGEIWNRRKDGSIYPEWEMITRIDGEEGELLGYVAQFSEITRRKLTENEIRYRGNYDALTGLVNRSLLIERLEQSIKDHKRHGSMLAVLFIDLDKFKHINDTLGHAVGDLLLKEAAERIQTLVRETDTTARIGGDEFVVLLTEQQSQNACEHIAAKVVDSLSQPFDINGRNFEIAASIGISIFPNDGNSSEALFRNADLAMYRAKSVGGNQLQFYTESMEREYLERRQMETDLRQALARQELLLYYQPIVDMYSGSAVGVEALIRWQHSQHGLVLPNEFIPLAEETGLISKIGLWVIEEVCRQLHEWKSQGINLYASINVSAHQIPHGIPLEQLEMAVKEKGLSPGNIVLEVTESIFVQNVDEVARWLSAVREKGFKVYLDDFGTGYSSLSYLKQFPVDAIKIDQLFVREMTSNEQDKALVRTMMLISEEFGLKVVAEGIETEEQKTLLQTMQCAYGQGYLFSRPLPASLVVNLLPRQ